jgi:hypothetical protein
MRRRISPRSARGSARRPGWEAADRLRRPPADAADRSGDEPRPGCDAPGSRNDDAPLGRCGSALGFDDLSARRCSDDDGAMTPAEETRERIATLAVTLRAFTQAAGAEAAMLLLDRGDGGQPFVVDCPQEGVITLAEGEQLVELEPSRLAAEPLPIPTIRPLGPFFVAALLTELDAAADGRGAGAADHAGAAGDLGLGAAAGLAGDVGPDAGDGPVALLAGALLQLTGSFPGRSVVSATFLTDDPERPLQLTARAGDPLVASLGEQQFELPAGWPAP